MGIVLYSTLHLYSRTTALAGRKSLANSAECYFWPPSRMVYHKNTQSYLLPKNRLWIHGRVYRRRSTCRVVSPDVRPAEISHAWLLPAVKFGDNQKAVREDNDIVT